MSDNIIEAIFPTHENTLHLKPVSTVKQYKIYNLHTTSF